MNKQTFVLHARSHQHHWSGVGALSLKLFPRGGALYRSGRAAYRVNERSYLLLNAGQPYEIMVDAPEPVESFCVFFADGLAEQVSRSLSAPEDRLLDDPLPPLAAPALFCDRVYPHDALVSPLLLALRAGYSLHGADPLWLDEQSHRLVARLLCAQSLLRAEAERLLARRATTRAELYRRLHRARDYAAAMFDQPVRLEDMAHAAALSPNHLLRGFRQLFGQTPHQHLTAVRLEHARGLLRETDLPITAICFAVGFSSLGSFSSLFRRATGCSPQRYRATG